jgi:S-adenosylmethionine decarboxylase proenzyme
MTKNNPAYLGYQTLIELYGCPSELIDDENIVKKILLNLADVVELTVVNSLIHHFSPIGVSGVIVIEESHIAIHTWPEYNYVAIDFFTCNQQYDLKNGIEFLRENFKAKEVEVKEVHRGSVQKINNFHWATPKVENKKTSA